jgi:hypothetical protein
MGPKFRRQHTVGRYTLDFYCPAARLAIELDGGQHYGGMQLLRDEARDAWLAEQGIRVLRFSDRDMLLEADSVEEAIWLVVQERASQNEPPSAPSPRPSPPADAGGEGDPGLPAGIRDQACPAQHVAPSAPSPRPSPPADAGGEGDPGLPAGIRDQACPASGTLIGSREEARPDGARWCRFGPSP